MPSPSTKKTVAPDELPSIIAELDALTTPHLAVRDAVRQMSNSIKAARARGCTDDQILSVLKKRGIEISHNTLRAYLSDAKPKTRPPAKQAAIAAATDLSGAQPAVDQPPTADAGLPERNYGFQVVGLR